MIIRPPTPSEALARLQREWISARFQTARERPKLYHYSGTQALQGAITNNEFWATHVREMNDDQEIIYGQALLRELVDRTSVTEGTLFARVIECVGEMIPEFMDLLCVYLVCFSANPNSALLWHNYGRYSLFLDAFSIRDPNEPNPCFTLAPVEYNRASQLATLSEPIGQVRVELLTQPADLPYDGEGGARWLASKLAGELAQRVTTMKSACWAGEEEWRLIYAQPVHGARPVHERTLHSEIKHFVNLPIRGDNAKHDGRIPILAITRDDSAELDAAAIAALLLDHDYPLDRIDILERASLV